MNNYRVSGGIGQGDSAVHRYLNLHSGHGGGLGIVKFFLEYLCKRCRIFQIIIVAGSPVGDGCHQMLIEISPDTDRADCKFLFHGDGGNIGQGLDICYPFVGKAVGDQNDLGGICMVRWEIRRLIPA